MATESHTFGLFPSSASVTINTDGRVVARSATQDIGTGMYTVMTQVGAQSLGVDMDAVTFVLGNTRFWCALQHHLLSQGPLFRIEAWQRSRACRSRTEGQASKNSLGAFGFRAR